MHITIGSFSLYRCNHVPSSVACLFCTINLATGNKAIIIIYAVSLAHDIAINGECAELCKVWQVAIAIYSRLIGFCGDTYST